MFTGYAVYGMMEQGSNFIAPIAVEGVQNAVDHCGNDGNFLPYSIIFYTIHKYIVWFDKCIDRVTNVPYQASNFPEINRRQWR
jgi:hypothetical protein